MELAVDDGNDELRGVLGEGAGVETLMRFTPAQSSAETGLFRVIEDVSREHFSGATVVPAVLTGFTDSHFLRDLGITAYGYTPFVIPSEDFAGIHGNDERISVENVRRGVQVMSDRGQRDVGSHRDGQRVNGLNDRPAV